MITSNVWAHNPLQFRNDAKRNTTHFFQRGSVVAIQGISPYSRVRSHLVVPMGSTTPRQQQKLLQQ